MTVLVAGAVFWCAYVWSGFLTTLASRRGVGGPRDSRCPACGRRIPAACRAPVVGWLIARGRCGGCHAKIPRAYPAVETLALLALLSLAMANGGLASGTGMASMAVGALALAASVMLIAHAPRNLTLGIVTCLVIGRIALWAGTGTHDPSALVAALSAAAMFAIAAISHHREIGALGALLLPLSVTGIWSVAWLIAAPGCVVCSRGIAGLGSGEQASRPRGDGQNERGSWSERDQSRSV